MAFGEANKGHFPKALLSPYPMVFENHRKSLIQHCERSELSLHWKTKIKRLKAPWPKLNQKCQMRLYG